ncbi:MAG: hypothetical protein A2086_02405 [Spirochaetes bacterium GWD1_27_9]|nr:MAG: hypothetical protein A2Z98_08270 [Spirochaetes bacterium GWB1_27_13]OHD27765.1 MAG: hypothetical protein A2Y34_09000 [Spirochaetes bacterium GWC1_27_15]OHD31582.1 MAG: hypothetical protein A2086_02405 [Spirochaetes bacterium GWD1_27_9]
MLLKYNKPIIMYNPKAGGGKAREKFEIYYKKLKESNIFTENIDFCETESRDDAISKAINISEQNNNDVIITIGGDGTISTIVNALMTLPKEKRLPLLPLPSGTGDSLLRDFNVTDIDLAIANLKKIDSPKFFDLLFLEELEGNYKYYCINVLGMGFISDAANYAVKGMKKFGAMGYVYAIFAALGNFKPYKTTIKYNDGKNTYQSDKVFFLTISNTKYSGGAVKIAPDAIYNDNLMDIVILHDINRFQFLNGFRKAFKGKHLGKKGCTHFQTNSIEIHSEPKFQLMPDGELEGTSPLRVSILPKEIALVV